MDGVAAYNLKAHNLFVFHLLSFFLLLHVYQRGGSSRPPLHQESNENGTRHKEDGLSCKKNCKGGNENSSVSGNSI